MIKLSKKVISCLLVFAMCFCTVAANAENTDNTADNVATTATEAMSVSSEIQELMSLLRLFDIIPEYYDYNVPIASEVSRADFAAAVARLMGKNVYSGENVYFYDVPKTHWAYNEISNLAEMGIINGSANKMFNPDVAITKAEAYKILLTVMGYGVYAENKGGYPAGYIDIANKVDLTKGIGNNNKIIMSDMFYLIYNAMKINVMDTVVSGGGIIYEAQEKGSLLSVYRDVYYGKGVVEGANSVTLDNKSLKRGDVLIDGVIYSAGDIDMFEYIGQEIEFFYHEDDAENKTVLWASGLDKDCVLSMEVEDDASFDERTFAYTYYDENDKKKTIRLERGMTLIYNGGVVESGYDEILNQSGYSVKFVKNDNKYNLAVVKKYENYVVGSISLSDYKIYDKIVPQRSIVLDEGQYDSFSITMSGLTDMAFEDIKQDSVLSVFESKDKKHIEVVVSNNFVVGKIQKMSTDELYYNIWLSDTEYKMDKAVYNSTFSSGDDVRAYLDVFGKIAYIEVTDGKFKGAFLIELYPENNGDDELIVKHLAEDGNITSSKCAEKVVIDGRRYDGATAIYEQLVAGEREFASQFALIKKNSDNEIIEFDTVNYNPQYETTSSLAIDVPFKNEGDTDMKLRQVRASAAAARIGEKIIFDTDTIVFSIPMTDNYKEADREEFAVLPATGLTNDSGIYAQSYRITEDGGISKYLLVQGYDQKSTTFEYPIVVNNIGEGVNDDNCVVEVLNGYQGNTAVSVAAPSNSPNMFSENGALPGTLVKLTKNNKGNVSLCTVLYDYRRGTDNTNTALNDTMGVFGGYVNTIVGDVVKIGFESGDAFDYAIRAGSSPVLIYDTQSTRNPIYSGNIGDAISYKNDPEGCSNIVIITTRMQARMFLIYK